MFVFNLVQSGYMFFKKAALPGNGRLTGRAVLGIDYPLEY